MATLQKFKHLATQCAVAGSPTRSPTASPVIRIRRRRTLRMLLNRNRLSRRDDADDLEREIANKSPEIKHRKIRAKLKDLFVSSPPLEDQNSEISEDREGLLPVTGSLGSGGFLSRRGAPSPLRPVSGSFRYRFLRRAWRPVLVTIPESE